MATSSKIIEKHINQKTPSSGKRQLPTSDKIGSILLVTIAVIALMLMVLPEIVIVIISFDSGPLLRFPPQAFSFERYAAVFSNEGLIASAKLSLYSAIITVILDIFLGVPAAIGIVRGNFKLKSAVMSFLQSPMMIPGIVIGISILFFVSFLGFNISIPLMILSHVVVTLPYVVRITTARMESADKALEEAAENLGANRVKVFRYIMLPQLMPGIIGGSAFAFLLSFDQLPVSLFTSPILDPSMPVFLYRLLAYTVDPLVAAIATIEIVITMIIFILASKNGQSPALLVK